MFTDQEMVNVMLLENMKEPKDEAAKDKKKQVSIWGKLLIIAALIVLAVSIYGIICVAGLNGELQRYGMGSMTIDDLISTSETLGRYTGSSIYRDMGADGLTIMIIKHRWILFFTSLCLTAMYAVTSKKQKQHQKNPNEMHKG